MEERNHRTHSRGDARSRALILINEAIRSAVVPTKVDMDGPASAKNLVFRPASHFY